jgi:prefoldin subunit 5
MDLTRSRNGQTGGVALNDETVEQAIRRHERWLAEHETAIHKHEESLKEFWAAMRAATERADRMDRRLERFERVGIRRLETLDAKIGALADNQATIQAGLQALTALIDRLIRGQQRDGHE